MSLTRHKSLSSLQAYLNTTEQERKEAMRATFENPRSPQVSAAKELPDDFIRFALQLWKVQGGLGGVKDLQPPGNRV